MRWQFVEQTRATAILSRPRVPPPLSLSHSLASPPPLPCLSTFSLRLRLARTYAPTQASGQARIHPYPPKCTILIHPYPITHPPGHMGQGRGQRVRFQQRTRCSLDLCVSVLVSESQWSEPPRNHGGQAMIPTSCVCVRAYVNACVRACVFEPANLYENGA